MRLGTVTRWLAPALLLAVAGCGAAPTSAVAHPSVRIVAPVNGAKETAPVGDASVTVRVSVSHFTILPGRILPGGSETAGSGQLWLYENGKLLTRTATTVQPLNLSPGTYTLKAVLVTNGKTVASSAPTVVSVLPAPTPTPTPTPGPVTPGAGTGTGAMEPTGWTARRRARQHL